MRKLILPILIFSSAAVALAETKQTPPPSPPAAAPAAPPAEADRIGEIAKEAGLSEALVAKLSADQLVDVVKRHHAAQHDDVPAVAIVVPVAVMIAVLLIVIAGLYVASRKDAHRHETIRKLIEKEAPIPPELLTPTTRRSDLRRGLVFVGSGLGLALALLAIPGTDRTWAIGAIPLFIGLGYLITWRIEGQSAASNP